MSDYRFGDDYKLSIYPKDAMDCYGEIDMDKVEAVEIEYVDFIRKSEDKSRWAELFGTPERAEATFADFCNACDTGECNDCPLDRLTDFCIGYDELLEWLSGDAE